MRLNKLGTNANQNIEYPQFVNLINKAQLHWVESRMKGFELNVTRVDELQQLLKDYESTGSKKENYYDFKIPSDYFHYVRAYTNAKDCNSKIYIRLVEEGNVNALLQDAFTRPSSAWEETFCTVFKNNVRVYIDNFSIDKLYFKYIRKPIVFDIEGYTRLDGSASYNIDLEFDGVNAEEIIDLAVQIASGDIADDTRYQITSQRVQEYN